MNALTIKEIEHLAFRLAKETMAWYEPIPAFDTRYPNILESCLAAPFQKFGGKFLYKGNIQKSAILFYLMIKNHPFKNGNKRIAMTTLFYYLYKNNKWIKVDHQELYNFAQWVASSNPKLKDETVKAIERFLQVYVVKRR